MIFIVAAIFKFRDRKRKTQAETPSDNTNAAAIPADGDTEKQDNVEEQPKPAGESAPHLTVLSRVGSRLSDTVGIGTWTVADNTAPLTGEQHFGFGLGELERGSFEITQKAGRDGTE